MVRRGVVCPGQALLLIFVFLYLELTSCLAETTSQRCLVLFAVRSLSKIHSLVAWASLSESECKGTHFYVTGKTYGKLFLRINAILNERGQNIGELKLE